MRHFFLILLTICVVLSGHAQTAATGRLAGRITSNKGLPLELVSVSLPELQRGTLTDEKGNYLFTNLAPGQYTVKIQLLGAPETNLPATVAAGQTAEVSYQFLTENIHAIQEVTVLGTSNKFSKKESIYVARLPLKNLENPQVYTTVPKELIQEQAAISLGSIAKNVPGAGIPTLANQGRVTFRQRGFETEPNARNGVAGAAFSDIDPVNLERVEAIKGPSATLFGTSVASSYGGLYNRVTKKPFNGFGGEAAYYGGSWNLNRLTLDLNTPVNADKTALFRLNAATTFEQSFQNQGFTRSIAVDPSFSYQITDRLALWLDVEFGQATGTSVLRFNPYTGSGKTQSIADMRFPYDNLFGANDLTYQTQMLNIFGQLNYKISESWQSQTVFSRARSSIDGYISALNGRTDSTLRAAVMRGYTAFIATDVQQNFIGDFRLGRFRNRMVVGLDYYNNANSFDRINITGPTVNFIRPGTTGKINRQTIDGLASTGTVRAENNGDNTYAAYVSDVFNVTDQLLVMGSVRADRYFNQGVSNLATGTLAGKYNQTAFSPKLGVVYEVLPERLSAFGSYMNGFFNRAGSDSNGNSFRPERANQVEAGLKGDVLNHRLVGTVSYYNIQVANVLRLDPNNVNYQIQDGTQESKGIELELTANPVAGLNLVAGYAWNESRYTQADESVRGLRPALSGPARTLNFWASYRLGRGRFQGLGLGVGGNAGSLSYQTNTQTAKVLIPDYTLLDAAIFYDQPKYRLGAKIDNLTSERAWSVRLTPQAPARFTGNFTLKF